MKSVSNWCINVLSLCNTLRPEKSEVQGDPGTGRDVFVDHQSCFGSRRSLKPFESSGIVAIDHLWLGDSVSSRGAGCTSLRIPFPGLPGRLYLHGSGMIVGRELLGSSRESPDQLIPNLECLS